MAGSLRKTIWKDEDPYLRAGDGPSDLAAYRTSQPLLFRAFEGLNRVAEIGVWKGWTTANMARRIHCEVLAVDHFRGSAEHFPTHDLYETFLRNMIAEGVSDLVTPLPLESAAAAQLCKASGLFFDGIHVDAAHDGASVLRDLVSWEPMTDRFVLDDYDERAWPGVFSAAGWFAYTNGFRIAEVEDMKALLLRE